MRPGAGEQAFGEALVVRRFGGGLTWLTEVGAALLPFCDASLGCASEALRALDDLRSAHRGRVRLGASQTVGTYIMPRLLASFRSAHPGVKACALKEAGPGSGNALSRFVSGHILPGPFTLRIQESYRLLL